MRRKAWLSWGRGGGLGVLTPQHGSQALPVRSGPLSALVASGRGLGPEELRRSGVATAGRGCEQYGAIWVKAGTALSSSSLPTPPAPLPTKGTAIPSPTATLHNPNLQPLRPHWTSPATLTRASGASGASLRAQGGFLHPLLGGQVTAGTAQPSPPGHSPP